MNSKCIQIQQMTYLYDDESIIVTHPFHPKSGKVLKVIGVCKPQGRETFRCRDADGTEHFIPIVLTNKGDKAFSNQELANSTTDFTYDNLVELLRIMNGIMCQADYVAMSKEYVVCVSN